MIITCSTLPATNSSPLKNGSLEDDLFLLGPGLFSRAMLVSGRVTFSRLLNSSVNFGSDLGNVFFDAQCFLVFLCVFNVILHSMYASCSKHKFI